MKFIFPESDAGSGTGSLSTGLDGKTNKADVGEHCSTALPDTSFMSGCDYPCHGLKHGLRPWALDGSLQGAVNFHTEEGKTVTSSHFLLEPRSRAPAGVGALLAGLMIADPLPDARSALL